VSERERFFISWRYYRDATQDGDKALELTREWAATYPRESIAFNSLGLAHTYFGQHEQAIEPFRESIRLDPRFYAPYGNLAETLIALDRLDEAEQVLDEARRRQINAVSVRRVAYMMAFLNGDESAMAREIDAADEIPEANGFSWQARTSAYYGQVRAAHEQYGRGSRMARDRGLQELGSQLQAEDAEVHALAGECPTARAEAAAALAASRDKYTLQRTSRIAALCGDSRGAQELTSEFATRFATATLTVRLMVPVTNALLAQQRRDAGRVLELLEPVRQYDRAEMAEFWPAYLRGRAHLQLRNHRDATAEFQSILDHRGEMPHSPLIALARMQLARTAVAAGDGERARTSYESLLKQWANADADLQPLAEARREYERLK
jgi:tetratricopeptide (TPR) repeat protein